MIFAWDNSNAIICSNWFPMSTRSKIKQIKNRWPNQNIFHYCFQNLFYFCSLFNFLFHINLRFGFKVVLLSLKPLVNFYAIHFPVVDSRRLIRYLLSKTKKNRDVCPPIFCYNIPYWMVKLITRSSQPHSF